MKYKVDDIRTFKSKALEIEAKTPLEAAKKAFPNNVIKRAYNDGDIVVTGSFEYRYGTGHRTYVYSIE